MKELVCEKPLQVKNWREELVESLKLSNYAENWLSLDDINKRQVENAKKRFPLMVPVGYADLIDWQNPTDPLRQLLLPSDEEESDIMSDPSASVET